MVNYPNEQFRRQIGLELHPRPYRSTRCQLEALGYRSLGTANMWDTRPDSEQFKIRAQHSDWTEVMSNTSGLSITASITAKAFYDTDSSD